MNRTLNSQSTHCTLHYIRHVSLSLSLSVSTQKHLIRLQSPSIRISLYTVHMWIMHTDKTVLNFLPFFISSFLPFALPLRLSAEKKQRIIFFGIAWWWINKISTKRVWNLPSIYVNANKHRSKIISHLNCVLCVCKKD